jgi:hypothetical protein
LTLKSLVVRNFASKIFASRISLSGKAMQKGAAEDRENGGKE